MENGFGLLARKNERGFFLGGVLLPSFNLVVGSN
jgi:hypothetical protein